MADTTSHDTVGASTLAVPYFLPSSPPAERNTQNQAPSPSRSPINSPTGGRSPPHSPSHLRDSSLDRAAKALDARLAEYTVDFSQFPSAHGPEEQMNELPDDEDEIDRLSAPGGPEDFTANLERYLMGDDDTMDHGALDSEYDDDEENLKISHVSDSKDQVSNSQLHQPEAEDEPELGEDSEFGPPVDMSTPSHLLRRTSNLARDVTHLENIEEDPDDNDEDEDEQPSATTTPSVRKFKSPVTNSEDYTNQYLRRQVAELKEAVQDRDQQIEKNRRRVLEAASAGEQIKHLQAELQKKSAPFDDMHSYSADETALGEQNKPLPKQNESPVKASEFTALQKQISALQKDLQNRPPQVDLDVERLETMSMLRQQLTSSQEQLTKRDAALDETLAKLREVSTAKEEQLREKNAEIGSLRDQINTQLLHIEKLETDISHSNREYQSLAAEMALLETRNRPLEEKNSTLEADLNRAQSQVTAQENALKAMAADLPVETAGSTYTEILELIKDLGQPSTARISLPLLKPNDQGNEDIEQIRQELSKLRAEFTEATSAKRTLELQLNRSHDQAAEAQLLIQSIESENTLLTKRADDLKSALDRTTRDLTVLRTEHTETLHTLQRIQDERPRFHSRTPQQKQQPSPPLTPLTTRKTTPSTSTSALESQIANLKTAHTTAISTLRSSHAESTRKLHALLSAAEKREAALQSQLDALQPTQTQAQTLTEETEAQMESFRAEINHLNSVIVAKDETAAAVDARIARSVEKREKEWERRIDLLLKERERMGKALLWSWGEKEVGDEDKENVVDENGRRRQGYRYKYVKK